MYDNALTSRTIIPTEPEDESAVDQTRALSKQRELKDSPAAADSVAETAKSIDGLNLSKTMKEDTSSLISFKLGKQKSPQSLIQQTQKEHADAAASTGIDEGLIQSLMKQNPNLDAATAAQLAQSMIEKEMGGGSQ